MTVRAQRDNKKLEFFKDGPPLAEYVDHYLQVTKAERTQPNKRSKTWENESSFLKNYANFFGGKPLNRIRPQDLIDHRTKRLEQGISKGSMRLQIIALRNLYKRAILEGHCLTNPAALIKPLPHSSKRKFLITHAEVLEFAAKARATLVKSGQQVSDWILLLAYSGARPTEGLSLQWSNIDFANGQLTFPAEIVKGGRRSRVVEFNPSLRHHLEDMHSRRSGDSWLFPSPRPNAIGGRQETFDMEFRKVRTALARDKTSPTDTARILSVSPHFFRHFFVSISCMLGVDMLTVIQWIGHKDSQLVREVYAHLDNAHRRGQAKKLTFERPASTGQSDPIPPTTP
jgi:integrase